MRKNFLQYFVIVVIMMGLVVHIGTGVQAGTKDFDAAKRAKFEDDNVESMRDVIKRREEKEEEYKKQLLADNEESIELLKEIRDLLQQLNEEE